MRDIAFWCCRDAIFSKKVKAADVYPAIRHKAYQRLREKTPEAFSLSILLHYADTLRCRDTVIRALREKIQ